MLKDITIGQYYPAFSVIHAMDPRVKFLMMIGFIVVIFLAWNIAALGLVLVFCLAVLFLSRVPVKVYLKSLKPIIPIIIFTAVLNALYIDGEVLWKWWIIEITKEGLLRSGYVALRIIMLILITSVLTYTTTPTQLTDAIERVFSPLNRLKIDVHVFAMIMTIALRFIPTLIEETEKIMNAQKSRGADLETGSLLQRVRALLPILIPLLFSAFHRAFELADAMECRCYHGGKGRTRLKQLKCAGRDYAAIGIFLPVCAGIICASVLIPIF